MGKPKKLKGATDLATADYRYDEKRKNIPPAKIAAEGKVPAVPKARYQYNPHLPPVLRFDPTGKPDKLPDLVAEAGRRPLTAAEQRLIADALRTHEPWLEWAGKREEHDRGSFEVDPVALHIHERVSARAILEAARRKDVQRSLFADPERPYHETVRFYQHDMDWTNRLILGDCLQVMSSLARRENLAGKVQMIYIDPPYGIKFASNFQPEVGKRDVRDKEADLTREPEMVRAYRDTWRLGTHTYLSYLRDRLTVAKELLAERGSVFVQISDENLHRVRLLLDDVFGAKNFCSVITFRKKTMPLGSDVAESVADYLLWYARDRAQLHTNPVFVEKRTTGDASWSHVELPSGARRRLTSAEVTSGSLMAPDARLLQPISMLPAQYRPNQDFPVMYEGREWRPPKRSCWKTDRMDRVIGTNRVHPSGDTLRYVLYHDDYPVSRLTALWADTGGATDPQYVVQTSERVVERCLLMATSPGDLVLDPTCGSGTTAYVAEQWGRRWITIDTSRVALSIARQRLLTAKLEHYKTKAGDRNGSENPSSGFTYKTVPHVTLGSIAQNANLDPIFAKHQPLLDPALAACNKALKGVSAESRKALRAKLTAKEAAEGKRAVTDADRRRWELPDSGFEHWAVPFDTDPAWPKALQDAVTAYRKAWRAKMDDVNACIAKNAEREELVDQPEVARGVLRVSGPFTVEGVRPEELSLGEEGRFGGAPEPPEPDEGPGATRGDERNIHAYLTRMVRHLRADGLTFIDNKQRRFVRLEPVFEGGTGSVLHAEGTWEGGDPGEPPAVAVVFGPQYGPVTAAQVEDAIRASKRYDELVIAGFSFEAAASEVIEQQSHPRMRVHQAHIRPDLNPAMDGLLKDTPGSQLFTVFGQPEIDVARRKDGTYVCSMLGVDIYDPVENTVRSSGAAKVAAWFLDQDYDGRCFCTTQAFFPDQDAWEKIAKALGSSADADAFEKLKGTTSIPFSAGKHRRIAVKVIDPRGNEVIAVRLLKE